MKRFVLAFFRRGCMACGIGPIVLVVVYFVLKQSAKIETLTVNQACIGILSLTALAFVAGGLNAIYQLERLPLMAAILIHGAVLYVGYLATYLINDWLKWGGLPVVVFTLIFVVGYIVIWAIVYSIVSKNASKVNRLLKEKRKSASDP